MPTYQVECHECGRVESRRLSYSEYDQVTAGSKALECTGCQKPAQLGFAPGNVSFVLKEVAGGWASKGYKENDYRKKRAAVMDKRKRDHVKPQTLQPNYKGQETGTWREAQEAARQDKGDNAASTYVPLVSKERVAT